MRTRLTIGISLLPFLLFCLPVTLIFSIIVAISGCVTKNHSQEILTDKSIFLSHLDTLQVRYDLTSTLKTKEMRVTIEEADQKPDELRELLWYKKTDDGAKLHIQALGAFNDPRAVAIANKDQFLLVLVEEQKGYLGELSDGVLRKIFGIDLRVSDVLSAIFANPFLDGRIEKIKMIKSSGNNFIVTRPGVEVGHTETITLLIHGNEPQITEWRIVDAQGELQQRAFFSGYREVGGILRPHKVEIERPPEQTKVVVRIGQVELNTEIKDSKFEIDPIINSGIEVLPFSELPELDDS